MLTGWGDMTTQWETRDADGRSGIDRQYMAWGLRLTGRLDSGDSGLKAVDEAPEIRASL